MTRPNLRLDISSVVAGNPAASLAAPLAGAVDTAVDTLQDPSQALHDATVDNASLIADVGKAVDQGALLEEE